MEEPVEIECQYRIASGRGYDDCVVLGRRFPKHIGPVSTESDFWIIVNMPMPNDSTDIRAVWTVRSYVTGIWRAPSQAVYATDADLGGYYYFPDVMDLQRGADEIRLNDISPEGVWGLSDDCVFIWGTRMDDQRQKHYLVFQYDGSSWRELPPLPHPINAIHGTQPDLVYAVGWQGMVSKWNGSAWQQFPVPTQSIVNDVHVESFDEIYAVTNQGELLEGSASGWGAAGSNPLGPTPFSAVAKYKGEVYIGAGGVGLMKRASGGGAVEQFKPHVDTYHLESRENLTITSAARTVGTNDNQRFRTTAQDQFAALTKGKPIPDL